MTAPATNYPELAAIRAASRRPLGGCVVTDSWTIVEGAQRIDLFALYLRRGETWAEYDLSALHGLDVQLYIADVSRTAEAVAAVSRAQPRSLRLSHPGGEHRVIFGRAYALRELLYWLIARVQRARKTERAA